MALGLEEILLRLRLAWGLEAELAVGAGQGDAAPQQSESAQQAGSGSEPANSGGGPTEQS